MTKREKGLLTLLGVLVGVILAALSFTWYFEFLTEKDARIKTLKSTLATFTKEERHELVSRLETAEKELKRLQQRFWAPGEITAPKFGEIIGNQLRAHGITVKNFQIKRETPKSGALSYELLGYPDQVLGFLFDLEEKDQKVFIKTFNVRKTDTGLWTLQMELAYESL